MENIKDQLSFLLDGDGNKSRECYFVKNYKTIHTLILEYTLKYVDMKFVQRIWHYYYQVADKPKCKTCKKNLKSFRSFKDNYFTYCNSKCQMLNIDFKKEQEKRTRKKYGVTSTNKLQSVKNKKINTCLKNYGVQYPMQSDIIKKRLIEYNLKTWGVANVFQSDEIKEKSKETMIARYNVTHNMKSPELFLKNRKVALKIHRYKKTKVLYQGTYELYFLQCFEDKFGIDKIKIFESNVPIFTYKINNVSHTYHPDFFINSTNTVIEIKSTWTFNKNGTDKILEKKNITKWNTVRQTNYKFDVLFTKNNIKKYVDNIKL